jgi:hypothetical protein
MQEPFDLDTRRAIKMALARDAYERDLVRIAEPDLGAYTWLVASHRGVFAVAEDRVCTAIHGWFFGICRHGDSFYLYENCGLRDRSVDLGRIIRIDLVDGRLANPAVLVTGLHTNCHQVRVIDGLLCVVDTFNQAIRRYTLGGELVDVKHPFPVACSNSRTGAYLHLNTIAKVGSQIAVMRHNGKALPEKVSELAWLDSDWNVISIHMLDGYWCHDIVEDDHGVLWHCGSKAGQLLTSDGRKIAISDDMLTRGLAISDDRIIVGMSLFGPRETRHSLNGGVVILDRAYNRIAELELDGSPTDIALL